MDTNNKPPERERTETNGTPVTNPPCALCGGPHPFDTSVPSVLWNRVVRVQGLPEYLCCTCVIATFVRAGVSFTAELYGQGFSGAPIEIQVSHQAATTLREVNDQNCLLRHSISEAARILTEAHSSACR